MDKDYKLDPLQIINNLEENEINVLCKKILKKAFDMKNENRQEREIKNILSTYIDRAIEEKLWNEIFIITFK